jgi:uncharacterized membrane protein YphA (DoxX/SURF4 family)
MRAFPETLGDLLLSWVFLRSGTQTFRDPTRAANIAAPLLERVQTVIPAATPSRLVRANGGLQVVAAAMLAVGRTRRPAAIALAASLVPTTIAGHAFWRHTDKSQRAAQRIHFDKNMAILGGLALAALPAKTRTANAANARKTRQ